MAHRQAEHMVRLFASTSLTALFLTTAPPAVHLVTDNSLAKAAHAAATAKPAVADPLPDRGRVYFAYDSTAHVENAVSESDGSTDPAGAGHAPGASENGGEEKSRPSTTNGTGETRGFVRSLGSVGPDLSKDEEAAIISTGWQ
jgi:hypothetical protein